MTRAQSSLLTNCSDHSSNMENSASKSVNSGLVEEKEEETKKQQPGWKKRVRMEENINVEMEIEITGRSDTSSKKRESTKPETNDRQTQCKKRYAKKKNVNPSNNSRASLFSKAKEPKHPVSY